MQTVFTFKSQRGMGATLGRNGDPKTKHAPPPLPPQMTPKPITPDCRFASDLFYTSTELCDPGGGPALPEWFERFSATSAEVSIPSARLDMDVPAEDDITREQDTALRLYKEALQDTRDFASSREQIGNWTRAWEKASSGHSEFVAGVIGDDPWNPFSRDRRVHVALKAMHHNRAASHLAFRMRMAVFRYEVASYLEWLRVHPGPRPTRRKRVFVVMAGARVKHSNVDTLNDAARRGFADGRGWGPLFATVIRFEEAVPYFPESYVDTRSFAETASLQAVERARFHNRLYEVNRY